MEEKRLKMWVKITEILEGFDLGQDGIAQHALRYAKDKVRDKVYEMYERDLHEKWVGIK
jgi:hypothetical protein